MTESFNAKTLGKIVSQALGLKPGDAVEIKTDRLNRNRVLVLRVTDEQGST